MEPITPCYPSDQQDRTGYIMDISTGQDIWGDRRQSFRWQAQKQLVKQETGSDQQDSSRIYGEMGGRDQVVKFLVAGDSTQ